MKVIGSRFAMLYALVLAWLAFCCMGCDPDWETDPEYSTDIAAYKPESDTKHYCDEKTEDKQLEGRYDGLYYQQDIAPENEFIQRFGSRTDFAVAIVQFQQQAYPVRVWRGQHDQFHRGFQ